MNIAPLQFPSTLSHFHRTVLTLMLDRPGEDFARIRAQMADAEVVSCEFTGVGGYVNFSIPGGAAYYGSLEDGHIGAHGIHSELGIQGDFELCVSDGRILFLEYVTPDDEWPQDESKFTLFLDAPPISPTQQSEQGGGGNSAALRASP